MKVDGRFAILSMLAFVVTLCAGLSSQAQTPTFQTGTVGGVERIRLAVADFKGDGSGIKRAFDSTLYADLANAGIFDLVSKSLAPQAMPGAPGEVNLAQWGMAPSAAAMVAFGSFAAQGDRMTVNGYLFDTKNPQFPQVLTKQYSEQANEDSARQTAHRFADEIILRLGGGIPGIAETKIYYVHGASGAKEIWEMDYDGANQHAVTHLGTVSISPRVSPDNTRLAFSSLGRDGFQIKMFSLVLGRVINFPVSGGTNLSPAWSPSGDSLAYSSSRTGDPEIWISDPSGNTSRQITRARGPDVSPVYNPRSGSQIAFVSGRTGLPQLYVMNTDGSGVTRMTDGGYATSVSWSPNGQFLAFAWDRKYGPGAPGGQDIYIINVATLAWTQLTNGIGRCDFPSFSPDGRHIVFAVGSGGSGKIMSMLVDGTEKHTLTGAGSDMPNWSWK